MKSVRFNMAPIPPFRLDLIAWALRRRANNVIDTWTNRQLYTRALNVSGQIILASVINSGTPARPVLDVTLESDSPITVSARKNVKTALVKLLGLDLDLSDFYDFAARDPVLESLVSKYRGFKPPRFTGVFEAIVNGIAYQQLSLAVGTVLLNRLTVACGGEIETVDGPRFAFPTPEQVASQTPASLRKMGFSMNKARSLLEVTAEILAGRFDPESLSSLNDDAAIAALLQLRGLGRWTAQYVLLRGLGRLHIYPGSDIGFRNGLVRWLKLRKSPNTIKIEKLMTRWQPWGGMIYFHMLLERLSSEGLIHAET